MRLLLIIVLALTFGCGKKQEPSVVTDEGKPDGAPCSADAGCLGGYCIIGGGFLSGYCTTPECEDAGCNGDDAVCLRFLDGSAYCYAGCTDRSDCRDRYECRVAGGGESREICVPDESAGPPEGEVGSGCESEEDCDGDLVCLDDAPGGYCTKECGDCPLGSECAEWDDDSRCTDSCEATVDCREGYFCDAGVCLPSKVPVPVTSFDQTRDLLGIRCDGEPAGSGPDGPLYRFEFLAPDAASFVIVPMAERGTVIPTNLFIGDERLDIRTAYRYQNTRLFDLQYYETDGIGTYGDIAFDWPIMVPYAPKHTDLVQPGETYVLEVAAAVQRPCFYMIPSTGGRSLALNIYLVGVGLDPEEAANDTDLTEVVQNVTVLLQEQGGVALDDVRYFSVPQEISERYAIVRSLADIKKITAWGEPRDDSLGGHLNIDVFLVDDILIEGAGVLGISSSLPGAPGLHGNVGNGLVFRTVDLGTDNEFVAHIMAHELAHYLGLRHTTEVVYGTNTSAETEIDTAMGATDPIDDTPVCDSLLSSPNSCPDRVNLMFPSAPPPGMSFSPELTEGQRTVLGWSPALY